MMHPLDKQLQAGLHGDFATGREISKLAKPDDLRAQFNAGWYDLMDGKLQEGMRRIDLGRQIEVFGSKCSSFMPQWTLDAPHESIVMVNLEGGLGDQIHGARWARELDRYGMKVILAGSAQLAPILSACPGVSAFVQTEALAGVYHTHWLPSMSAVRAFNYEWGDLNGAPYITCQPRKGNGSLRVGIRWAGNPTFEHEQYRRFDPSELFSLPDVTLVSLQQNAPASLPDHVERPRLATWEQTKTAIETCDLVISSCTSVAHLSAAMGKPTWIIVPILPYYLWALPGEHTPWYDNVTLFRQTEYGDWSAPLKGIRGALSCLM
jgi:hypothetical protein